MNSHPRTATVTAAYGSYRGLITDGCAVYHSLPYCTITAPFAEATALPLRADAASTPTDAAADAAETHADVHDATEPHPQDVALTVTTPADAAFGDDLPVLVYIHGGGYDSGSHHDPRTQATGLCARHRVVVVTVGYRTGLAGFAHLHDDEPQHFRGINDCQLALDWIQRSIESFGGDPTNVTLSGQSAGGGIALWLTRRDHYRGAFRRVLALSPAYPRQPFEERKATLRRVTGIAITRRYLEKAAERKPGALERGYRRFARCYPTDMALGPHPFAPEELAEIPIVVTSMREEFHDHPTARWLDDHRLGRLAVRLLARRLGVEIPAASYLAFPPSGHPRREFCQLCGDSTVRRWVSRTGDKAPGPVWAIEFQGTAADPATHCDDLPLIFSTTPDATSTAFSRILVPFLRGAEPAWPRYLSEGTRKVLGFSLIDATTALLDDPLRAVRVSFRSPFPSISPLSR